MFEGFFKALPTPPAPPAWMVEESHRRVVLLLNHVLQQEPQAMERLARQKGRVILSQWQQFTSSLTPNLGFSRKMAVILLSRPGKAGAVILLKPLRCLPAPKIRAA